MRLRNRTPRKTRQLRSITAGSFGRSHRRRMPKPVGFPPQFPETCISICSPTRRFPTPSIATTNPSCSGLRTRAGSTGSTSTSAPALLARSNVDLVFDGLDAAAEVYLNGVKLLNTDNMFRVWRVNGKVPSARRQQPTPRRLSIAHQSRDRSGCQRSVPAELEDR